MAQLCACGCRKTVDQTASTGRIRRYYSDACRKRAQRLRDKPPPVYTAKINAFGGTSIYSDAYKFCACGCGEVISGRKVYLDRAHRQKAYRNRLIEAENDRDFDYRRVENVKVVECGKCPGLMKCLGTDEIEGGFVEVYECQRCGAVREIDIS